MRDALDLCEGNGPYTARMPNASPEITALDRNGAPLSCAAKTVSGAGLETLRKWITETDATALILHDPSTRLLTPHGSRNYPPNLLCGVPIAVIESLFAVGDAAPATAAATSL